MIFNSAHALVGQLGVTNDPGTCGASADTAHFCGPIGVEIDASRNIYVTDWGNRRVVKYNSARQYQMVFGIPGTDGDQHGLVSGPDDVEVDAKGRVFVADMNNNRVEVFDSTGNYLTTLGGDWNVEFRQLSDVSTDSAGNVFVSDMQMGRIRKYSYGVAGWRQKT